MSNNDDEDQSILHYLVRIGVADDGHVTTAMTYLDWQAAHRAKTNAKTTRFELGDGGAALDDIGSHYIELIRQLPLYHQRKAEDAIALRVVKKDDRKLYYNIRFGYLSALDVMGGIIGAIQERLEDSSCNNDNPMKQSVSVALHLSPKSEQPANSI